MQHRSPRRKQRGVTLLELMIAVTLVAGLSTGMLMAMRTSLLTYEKTAKKLESNRRFVKTQQILSNQIAALIPVQGACGGSDGQTIPGVSFMSGLPDALRLVTSYSIAEGARGYPQIVEYRVLPGERGGVRLVATEHPYTGPESINGFCQGAPGGTAYVLGENLAYCNFFYHEPYKQNTFLETPWLPLWDKPLLPAGVRIEMRPAVPVNGGLSVMNVTVPIMVDRDPRLMYDDRF
ncbi:MAG TPA: prepilin-type N-terminal cleavage/methylation domain-containing protein [Bryobacteraceae bacterium]|nr:prepilin-type N-terminal cleavage/methylation domain-containing protein [Bryobacteraceae bacterium]